MMQTLGMHVQRHELGGEFAALWVLQHIVVRVATGAPGMYHDRFEIPAGVLLQALPQLQFLETMDIRGCTSFAHDALGAGLPGLTRLAVDASLQDQLQPLLSTCPALLSLTLAGPTIACVQCAPEGCACCTPEMCEQHTGLPGLTVPSLRVLIFNGCTFRDLPSLSLLSNLETVRLERCPELRSVSSLEAISSLTRVEVVRCDALLRLPLWASVQQLLLQDCGGLADLQGLATGAVALAGLETCGCSNLQLPCLCSLESLLDLRVNGRRATRKDGGTGCWDTCPAGAGCAHFNVGGRSSSTRNLTSVDGAVGSSREDGLARCDSSDAADGGSNHQLPSNTGAGGSNGGMQAAPSRAGGGSSNGGSHAATSNGGTGSNNSHLQAAPSNGGAGSSNAHLQAAPSGAGAGGGNGRFQAAPSNGGAGSSNAHLQAAPSGAGAGGGNGRFQAAPSSAGAGSSKGHLPVAPSNAGAGSGNSEAGCGNVQPADESTLGCSCVGTKKKNWHPVACCFGRSPFPLL
jgi:hypothetical protein